MKIKTINDVVSWQLCLGCGACASICPQKNIELSDVINVGIRPVVRADACQDCGECLRVCPGVEITQDQGNGSPILLNKLKNAWGPIIEIFEGHASAKAIRFEGSSGGVASALALYCLEREGIQGIVHSAADEEIPWKNRTVFSRNKIELLKTTGSRYSPASPCDGLKYVENGVGSWVFIGKPCDIQGVRKYLELKSGLSEKVFLTIGIFCAGTPATLGTLELVRKLNIEPDTVSEIRYRGKGWPGVFSVKIKSGKRLDQSIPYKEAWGFLQKYRPYRCHLCPDGTSEFADISCGDSWHKENHDDEAGSSIVLVRTRKGEEIVREAIDAGYVVLKRIDPGLLEQAQRNLLLKRQAVWGRILAMRMMGIPAPAYKGFPLFENWRGLPMTEKTRSVIGTIRRAVERKYYKPLKIGGS
jgi:coenzyme F420 hydrogenase subunit beta